MHAHSRIRTPQQHITTAQIRAQAVANTRINRAEQYIAWVTFLSISLTADEGDDWNDSCCFMY